MKSQLFITQLREVLASQPEAGPGKLLLACVSGGADSTALFYGLLRLSPLIGFQLAVCHVNHRVRGEEADQDEAFVRELCSRFEIDFHGERLNLEPGAKVSEADLRKKRLEAICSVVKETGASAAVLAHHRDDLVETFLMRLIQGAGIKGLAGFDFRSRYKGTTILRPLKNIPKSAIVDFLHQNEIPFREDHTNRDLSFLRNRMRHQLLPLLEAEYNPRIRETLSRCAGHFSRLYQYLETEAEGLIEKHIQKKETPGYACLEWAWLSELSCLPEFLLSEFFRLWIMKVRNASLPPRRKTTADLMDLVQKARTGSLRRLAGGIVAFKDYERIFLYKTSLPRRTKKSGLLSEITPALVPVQNQTLHLPYFLNKDKTFRIKKEDLPGAGEKRSWKPDRFQITLEITKAYPPPPLLLRTRNPGDTIRVKGQEKSLKKWFTEQNIPIPLRDHVIVIEDARGSLHLSHTCPQIRVKLEWR